MRSWDDDIASGTTKHQTRIIWGQSLVPKNLLYFDNLDGTRWTNLSDSVSRVGVISCNYD